MNKNKENSEDSQFLNKFNIEELERMDPSLGCLKRRWFQNNLECGNTIRDQTSWK